MSPVEIAIRKACAFMGADPETWRGFEEVGRVALSAFVDTLPTHLRDAVRAFLETAQ